MRETNQEMWPFGPAPVRACPASPSGEHQWQIIDLYQAAEPPAPSFQCAHCTYRWSRAWTKPEFSDYLSRLPADLRNYHAVCLPGYADEPSYAVPPASREQLNPSPMFGLRVPADGGDQ